MRWLWAATALTFVALDARAALRKIHRINLEDLTTSKKKEFRELVLTLFPNDFELFYRFREPNSYEEHSHREANDFGRYIFDDQMDSSKGEPYVEPAEFDFELLKKFKDDPKHDHDFEPVDNHYTHPLFPSEEFKLITKLKANSNLAIKFLEILYHFSALHYSLSVESHLKKWKESVEILDNDDAKDKREKRKVKEDKLHNRTTVFLKALRKSIYDVSNQLEKSTDDADAILKKIIEEIKLIVPQEGTPDEKVNKVTEVIRNTFGQVAAENDENVNEAVGELIDGVTKMAEALEKYKPNLPVEKREELFENAFSKPQSSHDDLVNYAKAITQAVGELRNLLGPKSNLGKAANVAITQGNAQQILEAAIDKTLKKMNINKNDLLSLFRQLQEQIKKRSQSVEEAFSGLENSQEGYLDAIKIHKDLFIKLSDAFYIETDELTSKLTEGEEEHVQELVDAQKKRWANQLEQEPRAKAFIQLLQSRTADIFPH